MVEIKMKYLVKYHRKGRDYLYFRFKGKHYRLPGKPNEPDFIIRHRQYLEQFKIEKPKGPGLGTIEALIQEYLSSPEFLGLAPATQRSYTRSIEVIRTGAGDYLVAAVRKIDALRLRDLYADKPGLANNLVKVFSALMTFAVDREYIEHNPLLGVPRLKLGEYQPWPESIIANVMAAASQTLRLAITIFLYTGQRISDVVKMTWNDIQVKTVDGSQQRMIRVKQQKGKKELWIPIHSALAAAIDATPRKAVTILANRYHRPFARDALRGRLRRLTNYHFHGLTKNAINNLLEVGCTEYEVQAITGKSLEIIRHYAKGVNQKILAMEGIKKLERRGNVS